MRSLFHIGLAKAGSTYLQKWWEAHPGVLMYQNLFPIVKRGKWQLEGSPKLTVLSDERFSSYIKHEANWSKRVDPTFDIQAYQQTTRDFLFALNPHADILLITRAPSVKLLKSIYSQHVKTGGEMDFDDFFEMMMPVLKRAFDYAAIYDLYLEKFPAEKIIVLPLEWMSDDQEAFLTFLEKSFGLRHYRLPPSKVNTSVSDEEMFAYPRLNRIVSKYLKFTQKIAGYRLLLVYIKFLSSNALKGASKSYSKRRSEKFQSYFSNAETYVNAIRSNHEVLNYSPQFEKYKSAYIA
ncbi:MAG: hypothetical protein AAF212_08395 [Verrucomicrobiota bacterium]